MFDSEISTFISSIQLNVESTDKIYTGVISGNKAAKNLYKSVGFEETGVFEGGMQELCMECQ